MENTKPAFYKQKKFIAPIVLVLALSIVAAAVFYSDASVDVTVSEALSQGAASVTVNAFPGETHVLNFTVDNDANVALNTLVTFVEDQNVNNVSYTTNAPLTQLMQPGTNTVSIEYVAANDTAIGNMNATVLFERVQ